MKSKKQGKKRKGKHRRKKDKRKGSRAEIEEISTGRIKSC